MVFDLAHIPKLTAADMAAIANLSYYGVSWDESQATGGYARTGNLAGFATSATLNDNLLPIQALMRRCVLSNAGVVQYYLDPTDSTKKADGSASDLTGTDGQVMVEIPKFYHRYSYAGTTHTHDVSLYPLSGFTVHNAWVKNGVEVNYRYMSAYEGVLYDTSRSAYTNGLQLPAVSMTFANATSIITCASLSHPFTRLEVGDTIVIAGTTHNNGIFTVATAGTGDQSITVDEALTDETAAATKLETEKNWATDILSSVSSKTPINDGTRANFRAAAAKRGTGWRQEDFDLVSAIQLLYLVEYADWDSQSMIGKGLTDWSSVWPTWNNYNPIEKTGNSNAAGNATANVSNGNGVVGSYMSYRGIENFFGHLWKWVDGINITDRVPWVSNNDTHFADETTTDYTSLGVTLPSSNEYVVTLEQIARGFLAASVTGSGSTYVTDYYYQNPGWRVAVLGGYAYGARYAGVACWALSSAAASLSRLFSGRLAF